MVRITRGDEILMARSPRFPPGMYSVLAGFVDPGETLEQTMHREVMEEVGLKIKNLQYFTSQSWPFPHSLMIAFSADYAGGEIRLEDPEIEEAAWFSRDNMPKIPSTISIARKMVDDYLNNPSM
jgi:NAD+ diphosphatase